MLPSMSSPEKGVVAVQPWDTGLVSRCPVSTTRGPAPKDSSPSALGRPGRTGCRLAASKPDSSITVCRNPASSPSSPSTLGMRHTSWTSSISRWVSTASAARALSCSGVGTHIPTRCVKIRSQILCSAKSRLGPAPLARASGQATRAGIIPPDGRAQPVPGRLADPRDHLAQQARKAGAAGSPRRASGPVTTANGQESKDIRSRAGALGSPVAKCECYRRQRPGNTAGSPGP